MFFVHENFFRELTVKGISGMFVRHKCLTFQTQVFITTDSCVCQIRHKCLSD